MPETKPTPGPWCESLTDEGVILAGDRKSPYASPFYGAVVIAETVSSNNRPVVIAAPDMLEALECANDVFRASEAAFFPQKYRDKWGQLFKEVFNGRELYELTDLFELERVLRRRAIAKAKGEADG